jgi:hypothetical protein
MSIPLSTARQELAKRTSEFIMGTATDGSATTLVDVNNLSYVDSYWNEAIVLFTSGTNSGLTRKISTFTSSSKQATLYSPATAAIVAGDTYELYRRFSPNDHKTALNAAINKSWPYFYEKVVAIATATHDTLRYTFPTGPEMGDKGFISVELQAFQEANQTSWPYYVLPQDKYTITEDYSTTAEYSVKTLQLHFNPDTNRVIRLVFGAPLTPVSGDNDRIRIGLPEIEWLYAQAKAELWRMEAARSEEIARKDAIEEREAAQQEADRLKRDLAMNWPPKYLRRTLFTVSA